VPIFLGLDCGGSTIRALAVNERGDRLFVGQSGAGNILSTPDTSIRRNIARAVEGCKSPDYVCGCFAGLVGDSEEHKALAVLGEVFPNSKLRAEPDFLATLHAADGADVVILSGTGSLVCSKTPIGYAKTGGRGYLLGDVASAYAFGRDAVNAFLDDPDEASIDLRQEIENTFGSLEPSVILKHLYGSEAPAPLLARFAKVLGKDATAGKQYALKSLGKNYEEFSDTVKRHLKMNLPEREAIKIVLAGGLWKSAAIFEQTMTLELNRSMPDLTLNFSHLKNAPVEGAVTLAKELLHGN
jgi:N-acetylglucosamine kinase-like BadF-type ATPase